MHGLMYYMMLCLHLQQGMLKSYLKIQQQEFRKKLNKKDK